MSNHPGLQENKTSFGDISEEQMLQINQACNEFEAAWRSGAQLTIEEILDRLETPIRSAALRELLPLEIEYSRKRGESRSLDEYVKRFPHIDHNQLAAMIDTTAYSRVMSPISDSEPFQTIPPKLGDYLIKERIGQGAMGTVYKAVHERMGRTVAIKVLRREIQGDPKLLRRFEREVRAAALLNHPRIATALDSRVQDGLRYLVTEFVEGLDLEKTVKQQGPLSVSQAIDCVSQIAEGLDYAHRQGVVHRDIKPANLIRDSQGLVKILDMGLARLNLPDRPNTTELTQLGAMMGTVAYMSPEQARDPRCADARSDIYSLGCVLHFLLTGRPPFAGESFIDTLFSHAKEDIPSLQSANPRVPKELDQIFRKMIDKDPPTRWQTAAEVAAALKAVPIPDLDDFLTNNPSPQLEPNSLFAPPADWSPNILSTVDVENSDQPFPTPVEPCRPQKSRRRQFAMVCALAVLATGFGIYFNFSRSQSPRYVLEFDGSTGYVQVPDLHPEPGAVYTLEAIVRADEFRISNVISWLGPDWMALYLDDKEHWGVARQYGDQSQVFRAKKPAQTNRFVHLAGIFGENQLQLFIDGQPVELESVSYALGETNGGLFIGGVNPPSMLEGETDRFFHGAIDAVRISKGVRYTAGFNAPTILEKDSRTIVVFSFEEGKGGQTLGLGKSDFIGTIHGARWRPLPFVERP